MFMYDYLFFSPILLVAVERFTRSDLMFPLSFLMIKFNASNSWNPSFFLLISNLLEVVVTR